MANQHLSLPASIAIWNGDVFNSEDEVLCPSTRAAFSSADLTTTSDSTPQESNEPSNAGTSQPPPKNPRFKFFLFRRNPTRPNQHTANPLDLSQEEQPQAKPSLHLMRTERFHVPDGKPLLIKQKAVVYDRPSMAFVANFDNGGSLSDSECSSSWCTSASSSFRRARSGRRRGRLVRHGASQISGLTENSFDSIPASVWDPFETPALLARDEDDISVSSEPAEIARVEFELLSDADDFFNSRRFPRGSGGLSIENSRELLSRLSSTKTSLTSFVLDDQHVHGNSVCNSEESINAVVSSSNEDTNDPLQQPQKALSEPPLHKVSPLHDGAHPTRKILSTPPLAASNKQPDTTDTTKPALPNRNITGKDSMVKSNIVQCMREPNETAQIQPGDLETLHNDNGSNMKSEDVTAKEIDIVVELQGQLNNKEIVLSPPNSPRIETPPPNGTWQHKKTPTVADHCPAIGNAPPCPKPPTEDPSRTPIMSNMRKVPIQSHL